MLVTSHLLTARILWTDSETKHLKYNKILDNAAVINIWVFGKKFLIIIVLLLGIIWTGCR